MAINSVKKATPPIDKVVQIQSTTKTDTFTTTSTSFTDITGLSVSITPTSASNKILVIASVNGSQDVGQGRANLRLMRDSTPIFVGDAASNRVGGSGGFASSDHSVLNSPVGMTFIDSPSTTSATTYKLQAGVTDGNPGASLFINRTDQDVDSSGQCRFASTITVMEVTP